jgi:SAM-dependent methyltransferase
MKIVKTLTNSSYSKFSNFVKIFVFIALLLLVFVFFRTLTSNIESFDVDIVNKQFLFKEGTAVYDEFYANIYDHLVFNAVKNDYEVGSIINNTMPNEKSVIVDIGCGTGHHVAELSSKNLHVIGIDISPSMIKKARDDHPYIANNFKIGDGLDTHLFKENSITHILCLYFTIYNIKDKMRFFYNCMNWLMPGGYLIVHLVDKYKVSTMLPSGNPLYIVSPLKSKDKITTSKIMLNDFVYNSNFKIHDDTAVFYEKFQFNDGRIREQEQQMYIEDLPTIVNMAQETGFLLYSKIDMVKCAYEYQYLYVFVKPT